MTRNLRDVSPADEALGTGSLNGHWRGQLFCAQCCTHCEASPNAGMSQGMPRHTGECIGLIPRIQGNRKNV